MIDRRPALIVRCDNTDDVVASLKFATENDLDMSVRCGGHSIVGHSVVNGGLMMDLSPMNKVTVDPTAKIARVPGGALLGALDRAAQAHGLATTAGNVSHTGVGGLTLAGGMGWLARQFGLACDNLLSCEVVLADGTVVRAGKTEHPDLFWGVRGGGGNFGIVTEFVFQLHEIDSRALLVECYFDLENSPQAFRWWRDLLASAPREATLTAWTGTGGNQDFLPPEYHGQQLANLGFVWVGDPADGHRYFKTFLGDLRPIGQDVRELSYLELQTIDDSVGQVHGVRRYWKGYYFDEITDETLDALLARPTVSEQEQGMYPSTALQAYGGAIGEVSTDESSYGHRKAIAEVITRTRWTDAREDELRMGVARRFARTLEHFASGGYVHTANDTARSGTDFAYANDLYQRLVKVKQAYDPDNIFHHNMNIVS
ncbi:MAG TPA: FAD-binding oxidoreductase [Micromonosporaceae bacterium]|nr:FAD-binding oxidoreductase [Micromonosporaceae bacterium]